MLQKSIFSYNTTRKEKEIARKEAEDTKTLLSTVIYKTLGSPNAPRKIDFIFYSSRSLDTGGTENVI